MPTPTLFCHAIRQTKYFIRTVKLWRTQDGSLVRTLDGHTASVTSVAFTLSGATLIVMTDEGKVEFCFVGPVVEELT